MYYPRNFAHNIHPNELNISEGPKLYTSVYVMEMFSAIVCSASPPELLSSEKHFYQTS